MTKGQNRLMSYEEMLEKFPNCKFSDAFTVFREATPEMTKASQIRKRKGLGYLLKFMQDNGFTRRVICETAPLIPEDLVIYYKDLTPEFLEFDRKYLSKWYGRFERNMHADPSDTRILEKYLKKMRDDPND